MKSVLAIVLKLAICACSLADAIQIGLTSDAEAQLLNKVEKHIELTKNHIADIEASIPKTPAGSTIRKNRQSYLYDMIRLGITDMPDGGDATEAGRKQIEEWQRMAKKKQDDPEYTKALEKNTYATKWPI